MDNASKDKEQHSVQHTIVCLLADIRLTRWACEALTNAGALAIEAVGLRDLTWLAQQLHIRVAVLDADHPDIDVRVPVVIEELKGLACPKIILTDEPEVVQDIVGLSFRSAICIRKPTTAESLVKEALRLAERSHRRLQPRGNLPPLRLGTLELDQRWPVLTVTSAMGIGQPAVLYLADVEHRLMQALIISGARTLSRQAIVQSVWSGFDRHHRTVDQVVSRLRESLSKIGLGELVLTIRGEGYCLNMELAMNGVSDP